MPELPEVQTVIDGIKKQIVNAKIINVEVFCNALRYVINKNKLPLLCGANIIEYRRIGKYIVIVLDNEYSIILHLGMSGKVTINPNEQEKHDHIKIITSNGIVVYNDARRFGMFDIIKTSELHNQPHFKNMGVDPFDDGFNAKYLLKKLNGKKIDIKSFLLDQSVVAGIGNIYASEILFKARVSPLKSAFEINEKEAELIVKYSLEVLVDAIKKGGSTLKDHQKPDGTLGYFQNSHCVYGKDGQECLKCKSIIKRIVQKGRATFYCERCQK